MEFSPKHRKPTYRGSCCVRGCDSKKNKNINLSFHQVPKKGAVKIKKTNIFGNIEEVDKRTQWLRQLDVQDNNKNLFVCSLHFTENDYNFPEIESKLRYLKPNAIPVSIKVCKEKRVRNLQRQKRAMQRSENLENRRKEKFNNSNQGKSPENMMDQENEVRKENVLPDFTISEDNDRVAEPEFHDFHCELDAVATTNAKDPQYDECEEIEVNSNNIPINKKNVEEKLKDVSVQVSSGDFKVSLCSFLKSEKDLMTMCGIKSYKILHTLADIMDETYSVQRRRMLDTVEQIILTTAKLKLDISFSALAIFFNQTSNVTVRNMFYDTLKKLSSILQAVISRVPKEEIQRNMPICFNRFRSTTSVLDCTEVKIQKPNCLKCRLKFYSHYKGDLTIKFMTEVTPAGILTFVSESFGGRASDKTIFEHSAILNHLESTRDAVMVDRGFLIDEECLQKRIQLIRPPFLKNQKQFSPQEAQENKEIACARVHIERMNQRIKQFQILNNKIPWYFIKHADDIFIICCGLANLGSPILADDKF